MSRSRFISIFLTALVIVLSCAVAGLYVQPADVLATTQGQAGRYQISSWASYSGGKVHHSGYYVLDTATGKIVDRGHEIHGIASDDL